MPHSTFKSRRSYFVEEVKKPLQKQSSEKKAKTRSPITPGTVLILLAGRYKGKRVVFIKELPSGFLLVTGPYKINGVPIRRFSRAFVIATTTKVDISMINTANLGDIYCRKAKRVRIKKNEEPFFSPNVQRNVLCCKENESIDKALIMQINKVAHLKRYLSSRFTLRDGMRP